MVALSVELEYALRIAGEKRDFCRLPEIEIFETREAFMGRYGTFERGSLSLDACKLDHLDPLLGFVGNELSKVCRGTREHCGSQVG